MNPISRLIERVTKWREDDLRDRFYLRLIGVKVHGRPRWTIAALATFARACEDASRRGMPYVLCSEALQMDEYDAIYSDMKSIAAMWKLPPPFPPNMVVKR